MKNLHANKPIVVFILGGPGSGKGTQSNLIKQNFKFTHLSAGDLLRQQRKNQQSKYSKLIDECIVHGKIVPSQVTISLLQKAMQKHGFQGGKFLIDGFPRNKQNLRNWNTQMFDYIKMPFIIHLSCNQQIMTERLLKRGQTSGRTDDNLESIKKRFVTYNTQTLPVVEYFAKYNKVVQVSADDTIQNIFKELSKKIKQKGF